jgi:F-type H+-transporting ATPase subunit b
MMMRLFVTFISFYSIIVSANEEAHTGAHHEVSVFDLRWPAFNFIIMFGFLGWKLKAPILGFFKENSQRIKQIFEHVAEKQREAEMKYNLYVKKLEDMITEREKILSDAKADVERLQKSINHETEQTITKMEKESEIRLAMEKQVMIKKINEEVLEKIISNTKSMIKTESKNKKNFEDKVLKSI